MLKNNNDAVIKRMAKNALMRNRRKNGILILAVMLSAFMLFTIFTVGGTWIHMQKVQELRLQGGDYDVFFYGGFTQEQEEICRNHPEIEMTGVAAMAGWGVKSEKDDTLHSVFIWADETVWNRINAPARKWVKGTYPKNANEVMATKEALKDCGWEDLDVGDSVIITYGDNLGEHTKEFVISGMWDGYGDKKTFYVSKDFFDQSGFTLEDQGRAFMYLQLKRSFVTDQMRQDLEQDLKIDKKQRLLISSTAEASALRLLAGLLGLVGITCLSAYLLIYNIMYLSVSGDVRYYGLLQTIGMTPKQIRRLVKRQMRVIGFIGISAGLFLGMLISFGVVPLIIKALDTHVKDIEIAFHPLIILLTIAFTAVTVKIGSGKPAGMAASFSPMEALGYRSVSAGRKPHKSGRGSLLWRMARERVCKDKKKAAMVIGSLGICLSVFLCMVTLIESQGPRSIVSNYMETDLVVRNDTMRMTGKEEWKPLIDDSFLQKLQEDEGIKELHPIYNEEIVIPWEADFMEYWMSEYYDMWMSESGESYEAFQANYQESPEKYGSFLTGIDEAEFRYLNSSLEHPVDEADFMEGKACILYGSSLGLEPQKVKGKTVSYYPFGDKNRTYRMTIQGVASDNYYADLQGTGPTLIVSNAFLKRAAEDPYISKVSMQYEEEYDRETEGRIMNLMENSEYRKDFSCESKLEELETVTEAQGNRMGIGLGLTFILAFIGIMNYINTSVGNLQKNQKEFSVMESIGMTRKQAKMLLVREGFLFAAGALGFAMTIGLGVTYYLYQSMNYRGIAFQLPVLPVLAAGCSVLLVCIAVPLIAYGRLERGKSLVERIREY